MENEKTVGNYSEHRHFVLKKQILEVLEGKADHLTLYKKNGDKVKLVMNECEINIDKDEVIIEVYD